MEKFSVIKVGSLKMSRSSFRDGAEFFQPSLPLTARQTLEPFPQCFGHYVFHGLAGLLGYGSCNTMSFRVLNVERAHESYSVDSSGFTHSTNRDLKLTLH
jgi:hypothetical protein